ncbi:MAG: thrombospondin type 3 repeat-containing protein, partial [Candidatus Poseidoniales archaeon]
SSIMGLEIGPNGHLYYVDNGRDEVIRIDPFTDEDGDGVGDEIDNCPFIANPAQANHDGDAQGDLCDADDDNDSILDVDDDCTLGNLSWISSSATDHDMDGCADLTEDDDDDNDGMNDGDDSCAYGDLAWTSSPSSDYDLDGCRDAGEDYDDDNDRICDAAVSDGFWTCSQSLAEVDLCPMSAPSFFSIMSNDRDQDGCEDDVEDLDDDNDGFADLIDNCPHNAGTSDSGSKIGCTDWDGDGYADSVDEFPTEITQWSDFDGDGFGDEIGGFEGDSCIEVVGISLNDRTGCLDTDRDGWSNPDSDWLVVDGADAFPTFSSQHADRDGDGYGDSLIGYQADVCPDIEGTSTEDVFGCLDTDGDGWSDAGDAFSNDSTQYLDSDMDGYGDSRSGLLPDSCPGLFGTSTLGALGCPDTDGDGWDDNTDAFSDDDRFWSDVDEDGHPDQQGTNMSDDCPEVAGNSNQDRIGCLDTDGDGWSDDGDVYPNDVDRQFAAESSSTPMVIGIVGIVIVGLALIAFAVVSRRGKQNPLNTDFDQKIPVQFTPIAAPVAPTMPATPQLPPEGLPPGWTMDQWAWYGADYLKNR